LIDPASHPELFTPDGSLRSIQEMAAAGGDPLRALRNLAADEPAGIPNWPASLNSSEEGSSRYAPSDAYNGTPDPITPLDAVDADAFSPGTP
jgi:hypothetical protein